MLFFLLNEGNSNNLKIKSKNCIKIITHGLNNLIKFKSVQCHDSKLTLILFMISENKDQLMRRIQFIERSAALNDKEYLKDKNQYDQVFSKVKDMIDKNEIISYLEVDSSYYYLLEKIKEGNDNLDQHAEEIRNFII